MDGHYFARLLLVLAIVLVAAKLAGHVAKRLGQPTVLGELAAGIVLGNLTLAGFHGFEPWKQDSSMLVFSQLGIILIVFQVGVQSTVPEMLRVGVHALLVGAFGVAGSFALGALTSLWLQPGAGAAVHIFLGATLSATSVGITARVLKDLDRSRTAEARIILGAAVVDDVLGLMILAVIAGALSAKGGASLSTGLVTWIVVKASAFLVGALALGVALSRRIFSAAAALNAGGALVAVALTLCFLLAWLAGEVGLAPIIGAFAAGLVLEDTHAHDVVARGEPALDESLETLTSLFGPVFFVLTGAGTDLAMLSRPHVALLAIALSVAAIIGKQACILGTVGTRVNGLSVACGMIPRGEVQLIFAALGETLLVNGVPVIARDVFSAIVLVVMITTLVTPPALKWSFARKTTVPH